LLEGIRKDYLVDQVITLGLAPVLSPSQSEQDLGVVESVVVDPLLSWILPYLRWGASVNTPSNAMPLSAVAAV
jgi:hypothetical protein